MTIWNHPSDIRIHAREDESTPVVRPDSEALEIQEWADGIRRFSPKLAKEWGLL